MNPKQIAGEKSTEWIEDGMLIGLGTGSTAYFMVKKVGELVRNGLKIEATATSYATEQLAKEEGIPLRELKDINVLDVTIDGADEFTEGLDLIKGGGGALYREKVIASISRELIIITDPRKYVQKLGAFTIPVEIVPFGHELCKKRIESLGAKVKIREAAGQVYKTDNNNLIFDCDFGLIEEPGKLDQQLKSLIGVVETGLFIGMAKRVIMAHPDGKIQLWEK
ncbi:MAG: ribose-5-phosphate isomerase RpiA [Bacteroidota bacterium]